MTPVCFEPIRSTCMFGVSDLSDRYDYYVGCSWALIHVIPGRSCWLTVNLHRWCTKERKHSIFVFENKHANQGSKCSSVPKYTFVVHNVALYRLGSAQDDFACLLAL